jgi:hypothetical protein
MTGKDRSFSDARWQGFLISVTLHALAAGLIFFAARTTGTAPVGTGLRDTIAQNVDVTITVWDEPVRRGPIDIKPTVAEPLARTVIETTPPLTPIIPAPPIPPKPAAARLTKPAPGSDVSPAAYTPSPPPPQPNSFAGGPNGNGGHGGNGGSGKSRLPISATAKSVIFVLDRSASMGIDDRLAVARQEIISTLRQMAAGTRFQVIVYNRTWEMLSIGGQRELVALSPQTLVDLETALTDLTPEGGNDHLPALEQAVYLRPEVICLLTDADELTGQMVQRISRVNQGKSVIHAVTIGSRPRLAMETLAAGNRGECRELRTE